MNLIKLFLNINKFLIFFILLSFITYCTKPSHLSNDTTNDTITLALAQSPSTLDPRFTTDAMGMKIGNLIFQSLVRLDKNLQVKPMAASKWTYKDKVFTFYIPKDIQFSNDRKLLKEDIVFSFNQFMSPSSPFNSAFKLIDKIKVTSDKKEFILKIHLKSYSATFLTSDIPVLKILPKKETLSLGRNFKFHPIGSGPFILDQFDSHSIILKPKSDTPIKKVIFKIIRDDFTRFQKILKKEIDIVQSQLPYSKINYLKKSNIPYHLYRKEGLSMNYVLINLKDPLFKNLLARQALAYGINKDEIIKYKLKNFASPALSILHPKNPFYNKHLNPLNYDLQKAKKIIKNNHWANKIVKIKTSNNNEVIGYAKIIAYQLRQLGFKVQLQSYEWGTFYGDLKKGHFQLALLRWVGAYEPDIFRIAFDSNEWPPKGRNRGYYKNTQIDRLVTQGKIESNLQKRKQIYIKIQEIILKDLPIIPLWHNQQVSLVKHGIENYFLPMNGSFDFLTSISKKQLDKK